MSIKINSSKALFERANRLFPGGVNSPVRAFKAVGGQPLFIARGEGAYFYDVDGNRFVDYVLSWGPLALGHAHQRVQDALCRQGARGTSYGACCELESKLAEIILRHMPGIEMIRFVNSGTEAAMSALRVARGFTGRDKIVKFTGCYHGHVDSLLVKAGSGVLTLGLPECAGVPADYVRHTLLAEYNDINSVERLFQEHGADIAAVIVEPVAGNSGLIPPQPGFLQRLRELTSSSGALLIFDEVMTGFRVHPGGAQQLYSIRPDLTMLGKVIGGGLPVGAFGGRREIMECLAPLGPVYQAGTLSGNPLAMAAGIATLEVWLEEGGFALAADAASALVEELESESKRTGVPLRTAVSGTMFGFFFTDKPVLTAGDAARSDAALFRRFFNELLESGVYIAPSPFESNFVSAAHSGQPLDETLEAIRRAFETIGARGG